MHVTCGYSLYFHCNLTSSGEFLIELLFEISSVHLPPSEEHHMAPCKVIRNLESR